MTIEAKKKFLVNSSMLYDKLIKVTDDDCLRRFLAFRIIVNAMCYEDLIGNRKFSTFRHIRNVLLSHKQEHAFEEGFKAAEYIVNSNVKKLIEFMINNLLDSKDYKYFKELENIGISTRLDHILGKVFAKYYDDFYRGFRISNNFLCTSATQIKEMSS